MEREFVHLARMALDGRLDDAAALTRRALAGIVSRRPDLADIARPVLERASSGPLRDSAAAVPVDLETRLELLRKAPSIRFETQPTWQRSVLRELEGVVQERARESDLRNAGLTPTRSILFVGPPGVGKTFAAHWLAEQLARPLLTLDLAAVMSSFLGRTGNNIRVVLDYARASPSVLLLDEFDSVAKRRDDPADIGELKRLVTVLLQAVDDWPQEGVLVAATNHPELLDPAVWRRFERVVAFPLPTADELAEMISKQIDVTPDLRAHVDIVAAACVGKSFAEVARLVTAARREAFLRDVPIAAVLIELSHRLCHEAPRDIRLQLVKSLENHGYSQRQVSEITGFSRDTLRKHSERSAKGGRRNGA